MPKANPNILSYNLEKQKIVDFCTDKFLKNGFYYVTVDQIATELRISKKTLYKYFSSKDEMVETVAFNLLNDVNKKIDEITISKNNSLTKALMLFEVMASVLIRFSENWLRDLQIHTPLLWKKIDNFRTQKALKVFGNIIKQGQLEGIFINKPTELIIHIFVSSIRSTVHPDFLFNQKFNFKEAFIHTFEILFNGILTPKGKKLFDKTFSRVIK